MNSKFFSDLPKDINENIAGYLSTADLLGLYKTSKIVAQNYTPFLFKRFLHHVARSEYNEVQAILETDCIFLIKKSTIIDPYGRIFENVSGFEYALWALDEPLWKMMLDCVPETEEGNSIVALLAKQYQDLTAAGLSYRFGDETINEFHFDLEHTLIAALQTLIAMIQKVGDKDWEIIDDYWVKEVGGAQKMLPMHLVHQFCSAQSFTPVPAFTTKPKAVTQFNDWIMDEDEEWFHKGSELGKTFAIYKTDGGASSSMGTVKGSLLGVNVQTLAALQSLFSQSSRAWRELHSWFEERGALQITSP